MHPRHLALQVGGTIFVFVFIIISIFVDRASSIVGYA
jgi:hypothetical protein